MKKAVLLEKISGENYFKFEDFHLIKFHNQEKLKSYFSVKQDKKRVAKINQ